MLEPTTGTKISVEKQPVTLLIENAGSNGPRPLTYTFDIATDAAFSNKVFSRDGITPGRQRPHQPAMTDVLATGHTYFWRVRAQDGANTGPFATPAAFEIFTPIVIDVPGLSAPAANSTVVTLWPTFTIANAPRSGPVGAMSYLIEVADSDSFANKAATWSVAETPNHTTGGVAGRSVYGKVDHSACTRLRLINRRAWMFTQAFQMLSEPAPVFTPGPSTPAGPAPNDAITCNTVIINSPNIASWPATTTLSLSIMPSGAHVVFDRQSSWPEVISGMVRAQYL